VKDFGRAALRALLRPATDAWHGLERSLEGGWPALAWLGAGLLVSWWVYVPVHELLHAAACRLAGGEVTRLQIAPLYGGAVLARLLPFVSAGGAYAGRLSGFDTHGSDPVYLATDLGPFVLTVFPGVWWLRRAARHARRPDTAAAQVRGPAAEARPRAPAWRAALFGAALPVALAPFLSLTGDAYEIGSILVTRLPPWSDPAAQALLRGDDLGLRLDAIATRGAAAAGTAATSRIARTTTGAGNAGSARGPGPSSTAGLAVSPPPRGRLWVGALLATLAGLAWSILTYAAGAVMATAVGQPPLTAGALGRRASPGRSGA
jgi:hypothetical protein